MKSQARVANYTRMGGSPNTIQYNTIQCESLVGQVAHPMFLICCGRASLLFGAFVQVGQCCWIVGYIAFRFAVGLCVLAWLVLLPPPSRGGIDPGIHNLID